MIRVLKPGGIIIWWDVAPLRWRVINLKRIYQIFFENNPISQKLHLTTLSMKQFFEELFSSTARQETIRKQTANYILPISKNDMVTLFPDCSVLAADIGLDYAIWNNVWKVSPLFAKILWYTGLLSSNCFGIVEKKKSFLL